MTTQPPPAIGSGGSDCAVGGAVGHSAHLVGRRENAGLGEARTSAPQMSFGARVDPSVPKAEAGRRRAA